MLDLVNTRSNAKYECVVTDEEEYFGGYLFALCSSCVSIHFVCLVKCKIIVQKNEDMEVAIKGNKLMQED